MQDADAEFTVRVNIGVEQWPEEPEFGRIIRVVGRKLHLCFEVATVILGVGVQDYERDDPFVDVVVDKLDVRPGFFREFFIL